MKNSLRYLKLWQKKRDELHIDADEQSDWLKMLSVLDKNMPVTNIPGDKKPGNSKGFKLMSLLFTGLSAAAMIYVVSYIAETKAHKNHRDIQRSVIHHTAGNNLVALNTGRPGVSGFNVDSSALTEAGNNKPNIAANNNESSEAHKGLDLKNTGSKSSIITQNNLLKKVASLQNNAVQKPVIYKKAAVAPLTAVVTNGPLLVKTRQSHTIAIHSSRNNAMAAGNLQNNNAGHHLVAYRQSSNQHEKLGTLSAAQHIFNSKSSNYKSNPVNDRNDITKQKVAGNTIQNPLNTVENNAAAINHIAPAADCGYSLKENQVITNNGRHQQVILSGKDEHTLSEKVAGALKKGKEDKDKKAKAISSSNPSRLDWGLLTGVNSAGSFTAKKQNSNLYGSLPADLYLGLFAAYNLNDTWALGIQAKALMPQNIRGSYLHVNGSKVDSGQTLKVTDSRKAYFVSIPLNLVYKFNSNVDFKAGPVINIPVKQVNGNATLLPTGVKTDSAYYAAAIRQLTGTQYNQKLNAGFSAGVGIRFKRLLFEADYLQNVTGYKVTSDFGNYRSHSSTFQFSVGFQLNRVKP